MFLLAGLLLILAGSTLFAAPADAATHSIEIKQYAYSPTTMSVNQGDTVTWTNQDSVGHDVQITQGPATAKSPMLDKGQSWSFTFATAGSYSYVCSVHPDMVASVTVAAATPEPARSQAPARTKAATPAPARVPAASTGRSAAAPAVTGTSAPTVAAAPATTPPPAQQASAPVVATTPASLVPASDGPSLDPLLLVAGAAAAVVMFCLLLMSSRPATENVPRRTVVSPPDPTDDDS